MVGTLNSEDTSYSIYKYCVALNFTSEPVESVAIIKPHPSVEVPILTVHLDISVFHQPHHIDTDEYNPNQLLQEVQLTFGLVELNISAFSDSLLSTDFSSRLVNE